MCFLPGRGPQGSAPGGQIQDPGSGSRIGSGPGPRRRLLSSGAGAAAASGDYNGSLLCLGHFKEKFSSMNMQPASLAHG